MAHATRQIDQIRRRVILGEVIAHEEKVFSIFEPHTEWISKGKAGVPVELGLKVCILEDQHQFILHHQGIANHTLETENMTRSTALGRLVHAEEIAAAVVFLGSAAASAITGVNLPVDCGYLVATPWSSYGGLRTS